MCEREYERELCYRSQATLFSFILFTFVRSEWGRKGKMNSPCPRCMLPMNAINDSTKESREELDKHNMWPIALCLDFGEQQLLFGCFSCRLYQYFCPDCHEKGNRVACQLLGHSGATIYKEHYLGIEEDYGDPWYIRPNHQIQAKSTTEMFECLSPLHRSQIDNLVPVTSSSKFPIVYCLEDQNINYLELNLPLSPLPGTLICNQKKPAVSIYEFLPTGLNGGEYTYWRCRNCKIELDETDK